MIFLRSFIHFCFFLRSHLLPLLILLASRLCCPLFTSSLFPSCFSPPFSSVTTEHLVNTTLNFYCLTQTDGSLSALPPKLWLVVWWKIVNFNIGLLFEHNWCHTKSFSSSFSFHLTHNFIVFKEIWATLRLTLSLWLLWRQLNKSWQDCNIKQVLLRKVFVRQRQHFK